MTPTFHVHHLGLADYAAAWAYQERLMAESLALKAANRDRPAPEQAVLPNYLLTVEHPPVYTLGKSGKATNLLLDDDGLARVGATFVSVNRGGDITFHGPGALVVYPILDLDRFFTDIHRYLRTLEEAVIPCGIDDKAVTSMQAELGREVPFDEVRDRLIAELAEQFGARIVSEEAVRLLG